MKRLALTALWLATTIIASAQNDSGNEEMQPDPPLDEPTIVARFHGEPITDRDLEPAPREVEMHRKAYDDATFENWRAQHASNRLQAKIFGGLMAEYKEAHEIDATPDDIDEFIEASERSQQQSRKEFVERSEAIQKELESETLNPDERAALEQELETLRSILDFDEQHEAESKEFWGENYKAQQRKTHENVARQMIVAWKVNKSLFERYGGRVIFQQAGPEPIDAYRSFLEEKRDAGVFEILDPELEASFWHYFVNDQMHNFYDGEDGERFIHMPWWKMDPDDMPEY